MNTSRYWKRFFIFTVAFILSIRQSFAFLPDGVNRAIEWLFTGIDQVYQVRFLLWLLLFSLFYYLLENVVFDDSGGSFGGGSKNLKGAKITMALALAAICALLPPAAFVRDILGLYANLFLLSLALGTLIALFYALGRDENEDELPPSKILGRGFLLLIFSFLLMSDIVRVLIENAQSLGINDLADWFNLAGIAFLVLAIWLIGTAFVRMAGRSVRGASKDVPSSISGGGGGLSKSDADLLLKEQEKELQDDFQDQLDDVERQHQESLDALRDEKQEAERQRVLDNLTQDALNQLDKLILSFRKLLDNARNNNLSMVKDDVEAEVLKPMSDSLEGLEKSMKDINDELKNQKSLLENVEDDLKNLNKTTNQRINKIQDMIQGLEKEKNNVSAKQMKREIASLQENLKDELNTIRQSQNNLADALDVVKQELQDIDDLNKIDDKIEDVIRAWNKRLSKMVNHTQKDVDNYDEKMKNELLKVQSNGLVDNIRTLFETLEDQKEELKNTQENLRMITESYQNRINAQFQDWENLQRKYNAVRQRAAEIRNKARKKKGSNKKSSEKKGRSQDSLKVQKELLDKIRSNEDKIKQRVKELSSIAESDPKDVDSDKAERIIKHVVKTMKSAENNVEKAKNVLEDERDKCVTLIETVQEKVKGLGELNLTERDKEESRYIRMVENTLKNGLQKFQRIEQDYEKFLEDEKSVLEEFHNQREAVESMIEEQSQEEIVQSLPTLKKMVEELTQIRSEVQEEVEEMVEEYAQRDIISENIQKADKILGNK